MLVEFFPPKNPVSVEITNIFLKINVGGNHGIF